jgi:hypothetical protein
MSLVWLQLGNMISFVCSWTLLIHERLLLKSSELHSNQNFITRDASAIHGPRV